MRKRAFSLVVLVALVTCGPSPTPWQSSTEQDQEELRRQRVEAECAMHPERCEPYDPSAYNPACEPPYGQEETWHPPIECLRGGVSSGDQVPPTSSYSNGGDSGGCPIGCTSHVPGCDIKGNISVETEERIYHMPGQEYYNETRISPEYGERWFCTEAEATANGWRRALR